MITEQRRISLSLPTFLKALRHCRDELELGIPPGDIVDLKPTPQGGCWIHIHEAGSGGEPFELSPAQTAAVIIAYARHMRIPLPKRGEKSLAGTENSISMIISVTNNASAPATSLKRTRAAQSK
jgi:hypothetical protein